MSAFAACVVGGSRGLGKALVQRLRARGLRTAVISRNGESPRAPDEDAIIADITSTAGINSVIARFAPAADLRYLVFTQRYRGADDAWEGEFRTGPTATRALIEGLQPFFSATGDRAIAIASSVYADYVGRSQPVGYHTAKAAMNQLARYYAAALGPAGIRVNAVMPLTYIKPETAAFREAETTQMNAYRRFVPLGRLGTVDESADVVDFLCSEKAGFISGQCLRIDGGLSVVWQEEIALAHDRAYD